MFDGEESAHTYAIDIENPWFIASHFSFVNYIYVKDYPIGIVLLRRALEDKPQKEYSIYYGVEKTIDVWDSCVNDDGCLEDFCLRYSICLETTEYGKQSLYYVAINNELGALQQDLVKDFKELKTLLKKYNSAIKK